ncbi:MAG: hypothetical protein GF384_02480 [Elusimicrobia bacterium]|nr:hypothetical protein [Elusimicrobiota bacterium]MBD3411834.1 hypothetical protein [Elusimicrobiota bacterium]
MDESVLIAGQGGQGILFTGKVLAHAALRADKEVTFFPSYGAEMRGGTAHCTVIIADEPIGSPIAQIVRSLIIFNQPSLDRFVSRLHPEGLLVYDNSMIKVRSIPHTNAHGEPATEIALNEFNNKKVANMVLLGVFMRITKMFPSAIADDVFDSMQNLSPTVRSLNTKAFMRGFNATETMHPAKSTG